MKKVYIFLILLVLIVAIGIGFYYLLIVRKESQKETNLPTLTPTFSPTVTVKPTSSPSTVSIPVKHQIKNVPYYGEKNFCYGASTMMVLRYLGLSEKEVKEFEKILKTEGRGGPPDLFTGLNEMGLSKNARIAYSKNYNKQWADFYNNFLPEPKKQVVYLKNKEVAFKKLKRLISQDNPVIALISNGNHYVVVTGYDKNYIYINNPDPDFKKTKLTQKEFFRQWQDYQQDTGKGIGFPGELGMIWFEGKLKIKRSED